MKMLVQRSLALAGISFFLLLMWVSSFIPPSLHAQGMSKAEIRKKFRQVIEHVERGEYNEATTIFEAVLKELNSNPNQELILELRNEAGFAWFISAMSIKGQKRLGMLAKKFLQLASIPQGVEKPAKAHVRKLFNKMATARYDERYYIMEVIASRFGQYLFMLEEIPGILGNTEDKMQIPLIILLTRMGERAVLPLLEILDSNDGSVRQNAAMILGNIRDRRAIPALARLAISDGQSRVRSQAEIALKKIVGEEKGRQIISGGKNAVLQEYIQLAEKYYKNDPFYTRNPYKDAIIWKWNSQKAQLDFWQIPSFLFNEALAEEILQDALVFSNGEHDPAWTLLLDVYFAQLNETRDSLDVTQDLERKAKLPDRYRYMLKDLQKAREELKRVRIITAIRGKKQLYKALKKALDDKRPEVAVSCIEALRDLRVDGSLLPQGGAGSGNYSTSSSKPSIQKTKGAPLVEALFSKDKRVRYAAAEALAKLHPKSNFQHSSRVIEVLAEALQERGPRTILIIAPQDQGGNTMMGKFQSSTLKALYQPFLATSGQEGIQRALTNPNFDLIIVSPYLPKYTAWEIIDKLRNDYRTKHIPIYVMVRQNDYKTKRLYQAGEDGEEGRSEDVISIEISSSVLAGKLQNLFQGPEYEEDIKARKTEVARKAAEALASIPEFGSYFKLDKALPALLSTFDNQPDEVKIPAMEAIAHLGDSRAKDKLVDYFKNRENSIASRVAACFALGEVLKKTRETSDIAYTVLKAALQERSYKITLAAGQALGKMPLPPDKYVELFNLRKVNLENPEQKGIYLYRHMVRLKKR
ncbi:MAG: hypothetical protein D6805_03380 [Planctomycetota bacterium]|nr:MAG: hypothetical protein D6805_03380 [Planctomycetota bacterium]